MADADNATRAPENDAAEDASAATATTAASTTPDAAAAPAAPKVCDDCVTDRPTPEGRTPTGEVRKLGDIDVYVAKPKDYPRTASRFLLLLTGGTGMQSTNNQIQADMYADNGFVVVMPDLFGGDVAPNSSSELSSDLQSETAAASSSSFLDIFKFKAVETVKTFLIDMWLARHTEAKVLPLLHQVIASSREEFADAVSSGGGIYAVGYCFGGRYVLLLAADKSQGQNEAPAAAEENVSADNLEAGTLPQKGPLIKAGVLAHATLVSPDDFQGLQAPVSMVCVENDPMFPDEVRTVGEDYMSKNNIEHEVQVYPGVPHGFAVVGDYEDSHIKEAQVHAFEQMLKWLKAH